MLQTSGLIVTRIESVRALKLFLNSAGLAAASQRSGATRLQSAALASAWKMPSTAFLDDVDAKLLFHWPEAIVVMGPSGCGKSTLGEALARTLGWRFIEGDEHHPPANVAKMRSGEPLTDEDRLPFLRNVGREMVSAAPAVASCSALRKSHRDILRGFVEEILFVWPRTDEEELVRRMRRRKNHFMPPSLLQSQLSSLEPPSAGERFLTIDGSLSVAEQVHAVVRNLEAQKS